VRRFTTRAQKGSHGFTRIPTDESLSLTSSFALSVVNRPKSVAAFEVAFCGSVSLW